MATRNELLTLFTAAMTKPSVADFTRRDANEAAVKGIVESFGLKDASSREIRAKQAEVFALMAEAVEELLPNAITDILGGITETKVFDRDAEVIFETRGIGRNRMKMGITEGARGGIYKARRLDSKTFQVPTKVETVSVQTTLEDILLNRYSIADLMVDILEGFVERIYIGCVGALRTAKSVTPAANRTSGNGIDIEKFDSNIRIAAGYGAPVIIGFRLALSKLYNLPGWTQANLTSSLDLDDVRNIGRISVYKGTPIIELPNYIIDESNRDFYFAENDIFVLPSDARPIKVAMKGDLVIREFTHPSGSEEVNAHRLLGIGLGLANNVTVYTDTTITNSGRY